MPINSVQALIVDDEDALRSILKIALTYFGINVVAEATNGQEAIERYKEGKANVVLMDVNMPKMDGLTALTELRKIDPDVVVLLITASDDENLMDEGRKRGAKGFLRKPLRMEELHNDIMTNLRILFAKKKGEKLTDDYFKYVVKPGFRPEDEGKHVAAPPMSGATKKIRERQRTAESQAQQAPDAEATSVRHPTSTAPSGPPPSLDLEGQLTQVESALAESHGKIKTLKEKLGVAIKSLRHLADELSEIQGSL